MELFLNSPTSGVPRGRSLVVPQASGKTVGSPARSLVDPQWVPGGSLVDPSLPTPCKDKEIVFSFDIRFSTSSKAFPKSQKSRPWAPPVCLYHVDFRFPCNLVTPPKLVNRNKRLTKALFPPSEYPILVTTTHPQCFLFSRPSWTSFCLILC